MSSGWLFLIRGVVMPVVGMALVLTAVPVWIWIERRFAARLQQRRGPNRVGPQGILQPIADAIKLVFKEDITPAHVDRLVFLFAPVLAIVPALVAFAVVPFGNEINIRQYLLWGPVVQSIPAQVSDLNIGILVVLALSSLGVYSVVLAGWSSNNKWSLLGGVRSAAQMVSYELGLGLSVLAVIVSNSAFAVADGYSALSLRTTVMSQHGLSILSWNALWQFPALVVFAVCALAETNRAPFDLPEAEQELTGGFHTEYGAFRFAMFFMGEYAHMTTLSAVGVTLFFGGWLSPFAGIPLLERLTVAGVPVLGALAPIGWFCLKVVACIVGFVWLRFTLPRLRWDQLMRLGWIVLLPLGLLWLVVVAVLHSVAISVAGPGRLAASYNPVDVYRVLVLLAYVAGTAGWWYRRRRLPRRTPATGAVTA